MTTRNAIDIGDQLAQIATDDACTALKQVADSLADGGILTLNVPNIEHFTRKYGEGAPDCENYLLGGGKYKSVWNREKLSVTLNAAGFEVLGGADGRTSWIDDAGRFAIRARKCSRPAPPRPLSEVHAIMSMPRVAWTDTMGELSEAAATLGINTSRAQGVFWGQCLERLMEQAQLNDAIKYVLTVDYDSIFNASDIVRLWQVMETNPDIDALCPLQIGRERDCVIFSLADKAGQLLKETPLDTFHRDAVDMFTGHFGLTLIRTSALRKMKSPLFLGVPNADGRWGEGRTDDDIHFWNNLRESGGRICVCPKVRIGHLQAMITWPDEMMKAKHQYLTQYHADGRPDECMTF